MYTWQNNGIYGVVGDLSKSESGPKVIPYSIHRDDLVTYTGICTLSPKTWRSTFIFHRWTEESKIIS